MTDQAEPDPQLIVVYETESEQQAAAAPGTTQTR